MNRTKSLSQASPLSGLKLFDHNLGLRSSKAIDLNSYVLLRARDVHDADLHEDSQEEDIPLIA